MSERSKAKGRARATIDTAIEENNETTVEPTLTAEEQEPVKRLPPSKQRSKAAAKRARSSSSTPKRSTASVTAIEQKGTDTDQNMDEKEKVKTTDENEEPPQSEGTPNEEKQPLADIIKTENEIEKDEKSAQDDDNVSDAAGAEEEKPEQSTKSKKKLVKKKGKSKRKESGSTSANVSQSAKPVYNIAGVNLTALFADSADAPPVYNRRNRRATRRQRCPLDVDSPVFAQHCDLRSNPAHTERRKVAQLPDAPLSTEEDILSSFTEWRQPPELLYAQLLWRYVPEAFLQLALQSGPPKE